MASDQQIQTWVNERVRPHCEASRSLVAAFNDDRSLVEDIYNALNSNPTWVDNRQDGPPHLAVPSDVLAFNAFEEDVRNFIQGHAQWPIVQKLCVTKVG